LHDVFPFGFFPPAGRRGFFMGVALRFSASGLRCSRTLRVDPRPDHFCPSGQKWSTKPQGFTSRGVSRTSLKSRRLFFTSSLPSCSALLVKPLPEVACEDVHYCGLCLALLALQAVLLRLNPLRSLVKFAR